MAQVPKYRHETKNNFRWGRTDSNIIFHSFRQLKNNLAIKSSKDIHFPTEGLHEGKKWKTKLGKQQL
jgi:hypothetical protein